jgi:hypothetical protein
VSPDILSITSPVDVSQSKKKCSVFPEDSFQVDTPDTSSLPFACAHPKVTRKKDAIVATAAR